MDCEAIESRILDYLDQQLAAGDRALVETHLAGCPACRALARQLEQLDASLARSVKPPALSAGFDARLRQRLQNETKALSEVERAERKRQLQAEFEAGLAQLAGHRFTVGGLLNTLGYAALGGLVGGLLWQLLPRATTLPSGLSSGGAGPSLLPSFVASAVLLIISLAIAFPRQVRRLWPAS